MAICEVSGCESRATSRGWCPMHYARWQRHGDPVKLAPSAPPHTVESLLSRTVKRADSECREWTGYRTRGGYGTVSTAGRTTTVHRVMYELAVGPIPPRHTVDHVAARGCVSRACIWPPHLEAVTHRTNLMRGQTLTATRACATECIHGHPFTLDNTRIRANGTRQCRACDREAHRLKAQRKVSQS
jgi:hypothetical protein